MAARPRQIIAIGLLLATTSGAWTDDAERSTLADRHKQVEQMTPTERELLLRRQKQFSELPAVEQERLRKLHRDMESDPDRKELQGVLARYHNWCKQLSPLQRSDLLSMTPEDRVKEIQKLRTEEAKSHKQRDEYRLSSDDLDTIAAWLDEHRVATLSEEAREKIKSLTPMQRRGALWSLFRTGSPGLGSQRPKLTPEDIESLQSRLSPEAQAKLSRRETHNSKRELLIDSWNGWIWQAVLDSQRKYFDSLLAEVPNLDQELVRFFESLPIKERNNLLNQSSERWQSSLRTMYVRKHFADKLPEFMREPPGGFSGSRGPWLPPDGPGRRGNRSGEGPPGEGRRGEGPPRPNGPSPTSAGPGQR